MMADAKMKTRSYLAIELFNGVKLVSLLKEA